MKGPERPSNLPGAAQHKLVEQGEELEREFLSWRESLSEAHTLAPTASPCPHHCMSRSLLQSLLPHSVLPRWGCHPPEVIHDPTARDTQQSPAGSSSQRCLEGVDLNFERKRKRYLCGGHSGNGARRLNRRKRLGEWQEKPSDLPGGCALGLTVMESPQFLGLSPRPSSLQSIRWGPVVPSSEPQQGSCLSVKLPCSCPVLGTGHEWPQVARPGIGAPSWAGQVE